MAAGVRFCFAAWVMCLVFAQRAAAFSSGHVSTGASIHGYAAKHGDLENLLIMLPMTYLRPGAVFGPKGAKAVYFGNWLRDFSQVVDKFALDAGLPVAFLRIVVAIFAKMTFGYSTGAFEVTKDILGVYRPEEHIDNPKGYPDDAQDCDKRLRGKVDPIEWAVDPKTGMKNYICNEDLNISSSAGYIRKQLRLAIQHGRDRDNSESIIKARRALGAALHTLEDFSAHSNFVELCLRLIWYKMPESPKKADFSGLKNVFAFVGDAASVETKYGPAPPLVTGTFGALDTLESILGEFKDGEYTSLGQLGFLDERTGTEGGPAIELFLPEGLAALYPGQIKAVAEALQGLKNYKPGTAPPLDFKKAIGDPDELWNSVKIIFELHEIFRDALDTLIDLVKIEAVSAFIASISDTVDKWLFRQLSFFVRPIIKELRGALEAQRGELEKKEKQEIAKEPEERDVFKPGSKATNPSHTQLAKDHFDHLLNNPAGVVAGVITVYTTNAIVKCWDDPNLDAESVIGGILTALHHPFNADHEKNFLQKSMYRQVYMWWNHKEVDQKKQLLKWLSKERMEKQRSYTIKHPDLWNNSHLSTVQSESNQALILVERNLKQARNDGTLVLSDSKFDALVALLLAEATPAEPNPVDAALSMVPLAPAVVFDGVAPQDLMALSTIGDIVKTTIVEELVKHPEISQAPGDVQASS